MEFVDLEIEETQKVKSSDEHQKSANQIESDLMDISINTERTSSIPKHSVALEPKLSEKIDLKIQMAKSFFNWSSTSPSDNKLQEKQSTMNSIVKSGLLEVELEQKLESALSRLDSISEIIEEFIKVIDGFVVAHEYMGKSEKQFSRFLTHKGVHEKNENLSNSFLSLGEALDQSQKEKNVSLELAELEKFLQDFSTKTVNDAKSSVKKLIQANIEACYFEKKMIDYEKKLESISLSTIATKRNTSSSIDPQIINRPPTPSYEDTNSNHEILSPISPASPISEFVSGYFKKFNQPSILTPEQIQSRQLSIGHDLGRARIQFHNARSRLCDLANEVICKEEIVSLKKETDLTRHMNLIRKAYSRHYLKMAAIIDDNEE